MKSNLDVIAEYLGCKVLEINADKKVTVADAAMLMHLYSCQFKEQTVVLENQVKTLTDALAEATEIISRCNYK